MLDILRAGAAYSSVMDVKGRRMIESDFTPQARLSQHLKDVQLVLDAGATAKSPTPLSQVHESLLSRLVAQGFGDLDNSVIIRAFDAEAI